VRAIYVALFFFRKRFRDTKSDPKFGGRGVLLHECQEKGFRNTVPAFILLIKNFWNGVPARSVTKYPEYPAADSSLEGTALQDPTP
jgi:hypothetical protein